MAEGGDFIKQTWLHNKLHADYHYFDLKPEIEQSLDLGRNISVSPTYTFYYSRETGLNYVRNVQIVRVYGDLVIGRPSISYIIIESEKGIIKIIGNVNYLQIRVAYNRFCPRITIGGQGREMGLEQLQNKYSVRRKALFTIAIWYYVGLLYASHASICLSDLDWLF